VTVSSATARRAARSQGFGEFHVWATGPKGEIAPLIRKRDGARVWASPEKPIVCVNSITTAMAQLITGVLARATTNPSGPAGGFWTTGPYVGLTTVAPTVASTLGTITEAVGNGYNRVLGTWATVAGPPAGYNNTASPAVFGPASGGNLGGGALTSLIVTPASSGTGSAPNTYLICFSALNGGPYTIVTGNSLNVTYSYTLT
jgi:hypothetical protein